MISKQVSILSSVVLAGITLLSVDRVFATVEWTDTGGSSAGALTWDGSYVYAAGNDGQMYLFDPTNPLAGWGEISGEDTSGPLPADNGCLQGAPCSVALAFDGTYVYFALEWAGVFQLDTTNLSGEWTDISFTSGEGGLPGLPLLSSLTTSIANDNTYVFAGTYDGHVYQFEVGEDIWTDISTSFPGLPSCTIGYCGISTLTTNTETGVIFAGTEQGEVFSFDPAHPTVGWSNTGLDCFDFPQVKVDHAFYPSCNGVEISALTFDGTYIYAGNLESSVFQFNPLLPNTGWTDITPYTTLFIEDDVIRALAAQAVGTIYAGTQGRVLQFQDGEWTNYTGNGVFAGLLALLVPAESGIIYAGTRSGVYVAAD